jgi:hypothetical protein
MEPTTASHAKNDMDLNSVSFYCISAVKNKNLDGKSK